MFSLTDEHGEAIFILNPEISSHYFVSASKANLYAPEQELWIEANKSYTLVFYISERG